MGKTATIGVKSKDTENTNALGIFFIILFFTGIILFTIYTERQWDKPSYRVDKLISSMYGLEMHLEERMLIMEKNGFTDSTNYKQARDTKTEMEWVCDKLVEIKMKLKDKPWAN